jgi:hypothetical protein
MVPVRSLLCVICGRYTPTPSGPTFVLAVSPHPVRSLMVSLTLMGLPVAGITLSFKIYIGIPGRPVSSGLQVPGEPFPSWSG